MLIIVGVRELHMLIIVRVYGAPDVGHFWGSGAPCVDHC